MKSTIRKSQAGKMVDWSFIQPYWGGVVLLVLLGLGENGANLLIPRLLGQSIDAYTQGSSITMRLIWIIMAALVVFSFSAIQWVVSTWISESIARDFRQKLVNSVSDRSLTFIRAKGSDNLLTYVTADTEAVKNIISQGLVSSISAFIILVGSLIFLFQIHTRLALYTVISLPLLIGVFVFIFRNVSVLFQKAQKVLGEINRVVSESVVGALLIRVLDAQKNEYHKFHQVNTKSRDIGYGIIDLFSSLIPTINLISNITIVTIIWVGGQEVIQGDLTVGEFGAFVSYVNLLITPIFIFGFVSSIVARGFVSLGRIQSILDEKDTQEVPQSRMNSKSILEGQVTFTNVSLTYGEKQVLQNISFHIAPGTKTAIVGPTAAGKSQIFSLISGLIPQTHGEILIDQVSITEWNQEELFSQIGLVFQESILFRDTVKNNITLGNHISEKDLSQILEISALQEVIQALPDGIDTEVSERGSNLSGGQKQRIMLARALAIKPKLLLLDDFTARVDINTEHRILNNINNYYPDLTLISITQKIEPIKHYDQIIVMMEGEIMGIGTHEELLRVNAEYRQIWQSQQSSDI